MSGGEATGGLAERAVAIGALIRVKALRLEAVYRTGPKMALTVKETAS